MITLPPEADLHSNIRYWQRPLRLAQTSKYHRSVFRSAAGHTLATWLIFSVHLTAMMLLNFWAVVGAMVGILFSVMLLLNNSMWMKKSVLVHRTISKQKIYPSSSKRKTSLVNSRHIHYGCKYAGTTFYQPGLDSLSYVSHQHKRWVPLGNKLRHTIMI